MIDISQVTFDERGLVPAILVDEADGAVLMMAWMNAESLTRTLTTGLATFWSRSRQELWLKGATSDHYMHVVDIKADCDGDTLLVTVRPDGAACHTGARTCFFADVPGLAKGVLMPGALDADYHVHTTYSDGVDSPRAMVEGAVAAGFTRMGITDHSFTGFDPGYCMALERYAEYQAEVRALAEEFADRIEILCGIEQDYCSDWQGDGFDYAIGSVHFLRVGGSNANTVVSPENPEGEFLALDLDFDSLRLGIDKYFGGDPYALCEAYYACVADVVRQTGCSIVGHFDLVKMFNGIAEDGTPGKRFFDENHPRYVAAWQQAADALLATGVLFEINVNGVAKGRTAEPYPSPAIAAYLKERGAKFVISGDDHGTQYLRHHGTRPELAAYTRSEG